MACEGTYARRPVQRTRCQRQTRFDSYSASSNPIWRFLTSPRSSAGRLSIQELAEYRCEATGLFDLGQMSAVRK